VRACDELEGAHTWDVAGRGEGARVVTDLAQPWGEAASCTGCGKCVQACPTGALVERGLPPGEPKRRDLLAWLRAARERKEWVR
jgi:bidirectional [NiFe] hydrogenase diaphorase subunit